MIAIIVIVLNNELRLWAVLIELKIRSFTTTEMNMPMVSSNRGMYHQSRKLFDYVDQHPHLQKSDYHYYYGRILLKLGESENAKRVFGEALEMNELLRHQKKIGRTKYYRQKGEILHVLKKYDEAKASYRKAIMLNLKQLKKVNTHKQEARCHWSIGKTLFAMGQKEAATEQIICAMKIAPTKRLKKSIRKWINNKRKFKTHLPPSDIKRISIDLQSTL